MTLVLVGIGSSVVASAVYAIFSFAIRPRIDTSKVICISKEDDKIVHKIKVVNRTRTRLMNVNYTLDYCEDFDDDRTFVTDIYPRKGIVTTIEKMNKKNTDYAVRISFEIDPEKFPVNDNVRLIFTITATHPFSNTSVCKKTTYTKKDLRNNAEFETGKSMKFINLKKRKS